MKRKKAVIIGICAGAAVIVLFTAMMIIGSSGAGSSVSAAREYIEASMLYDARGMVKVASDAQKTELYRTGELPSDRELIRWLNESYSKVTSSYAGMMITFTVSEAYDDGKNGTVVLNIYADGKKVLTRSCATVKVGLRWYYDGEVK
ncbi:MAG: hypothetical protein ACI3W9_02085 [Eubacteriales bacterium]